MKGVAARERAEQKKVVAYHEESRGGIHVGTLYTLYPPPCQLSREENSMHSFQETAKGVLSKPSKRCPKGHIFCPPDFFPPFTVVKEDQYAVLKRPVKVRTGSCCWTIRGCCCKAVATLNTSRHEAWGVLTPVCLTLC